jgi:acyl carrier protein
MDKYIEFLTNYIAEMNDIDKEGIDINSDIFQNSYIDSIGIFSLLVEIEDKFGKTLALDDIASLDKYTLYNIAKLME